jgi:aspartate racemase
LGQVLEASRLEFLRIIQRLVKAGAEAVILGCTKIGLLIDQDHAEVPVFDTTRIHAVSAAERALIFP